MKTAVTKEFVVGYAGKTQTAVYSKYAWSNKTDYHGGMDKMTLNQAIKHLNSLVSDDHTKVIFKLVPFKIIKPKK